MSESRNDQNLTKFYSFKPCRSGVHVNTKCVNLPPCYFKSDKNISLCKSPAIVVAKKEVSEVNVKCSVGPSYSISEIAFSHVCVLKKTRDEGGGKLYVLLIKRVGTPSGWVVAVRQEIMKYRENRLSHPILRY